MSKHRTWATRWALAPSLVALSLLLSACEDRGNPGDDNLLTGGSLVITVLLIVLVAFLVMRRRGSP
jgi:hypothetical protein